MVSPQKPSPPRADTTAQGTNPGYERAVQEGCRAFVEHVGAVGMPCLEVEYRLGHMPRLLRDKVCTLLDACDAWEGGETTVETDRRHPRQHGLRYTEASVPQDEEENKAGGYWMVKHRLFMTQVHDGMARPVKLCMSSEIPAAPGRAEDMTVYRTKTRRSWTWRCWRVDVTDVTTNDPALRDADDIIELELELIRDHDLVLYYDTPTLLAWGFRVVDDLLRACST